MKWLLLIGGAYLLLSKRQAVPGVQIPQAQFPTWTAPRPSIESDDIVDRVKGNVNEIIQDVRSWWNVLSKQSTGTPSQPLPPTSGPMTIQTGTFS